MKNKFTAKVLRIYAFLFIATGIFALVSSLFTWGGGWLFFQKNLLDFLLPMADLIISYPISLASGFGILKQKSWGIYLGLMTSGIYIFGSILVYIILLWQGFPYPLELLIPPIFGLAIAISFCIFIFKNFRFDEGLK
jgi:hypothetical protein